LQRLLENLIIITQNENSAGISTYAEIGDVIVVNCYAHTIRSAKHANANNITLKSV
jgi:hypothetical protein